MPQSNSSKTTPARVALYASVGPELTQYDVDVAGSTLVRRGTVRLPANVHYAWPHASGQFLYVASSDSAPGMGSAGNTHHVTAFRIEAASGALSAHGDPFSLRSATRAGSGSTVSILTQPRAARSFSRGRSIPGSTGTRYGSVRTTSWCPWSRAATTPPARSPRSLAPSRSSITKTDC